MRKFTRNLIQAVFISYLALISNGAFAQDLDLGAAGTSDNIIEAAKAGDFQKVKKVLDAEGADNGDCSLALFSAIAESQTKIAELLVSRKPDIVNMQNSAGTTALHYAASLGNTALMKWLIQHGARTNL